MKKYILLFVLLLISNFIILNSSPLENYFIGTSKKANIRISNNNVVYENSKLKISNLSNSENNQSFAEIKEDKTILEFKNANDKAIIKYEKNSQVTVYKGQEVLNQQAGQSMLVEDIYDNVDLRLRSNLKKGFKYDLILHPGSDVNSIKIKIDDSCKDLFSYQIDQIKTFILDGKNKTFIESKAILKDNYLTFEIADYPKDATIIIDPDVNFSTYYGGRGNDQIMSQKFLKDGSYIISGHSNSYDFPLENGGVHPSNSFDIFVMKYSAQNDLEWSSIIAGNSIEYSRDVLVDHDGNIWVVGQTNSNNFPITPNAIQSSYAGGVADGFISKLSSDGKLLYSTYFGSYGYESLLGLAVDSHGNVWMTGQTDGKVKTTSNAYSQQKDSGYDGFFVKVDKSGNLLLSCYIAGSSDEACENICMSSDDNPVIAGWSGSSNIGIKNGTYTTFMGNRDAIIMKVDKITGEPIWGSYFGGTSDDRSYDISCWNDNYYITGRTSSGNLPTTVKSFQKTKGGNQDNFVAKFKEWGVLDWCSYYGGSGQENEYGESSYLYGTAVNAQGELLFSGKTTSDDLPVTIDAFQSQLGGQFDSFIAKVSAAGNLLYSSYVGGSNNETSWNCDFDSNGDMFLIGFTYSQDFPVTENALFKNNNGDADAYIVRFGNACHQSAFELWTNPPADFVTNGEAILQDDTLFMHRSVSQNKGSSWYHEHMPVSVGFTTEFKFRIKTYEFNTAINNPDETAGGLAFVIQNNSVNALGQSDFGLGYKDIPNGIAIEFDTYKNDENAVCDMRDPSDGHIAVMGMNNSLLSPHHDTQKSFKNVEIKDDGTVYQCRIVYSGANQQMKIYFGEVGVELAEVINLNIDLTYSLNLKDDAFAFLGFTAANGTITQTHDIFDWSVCPSTASPGTSIGDFTTNESNIFVFPNPTNDNFSIQYSPSKMSYVNINMYDLEGKKVAMLYSGLDQAGTQTISMPVPQNLSAGVYIIEIDYGYSKETAKIIVE